VKIKFWLIYPSISLTHGVTRCQVGIFYFETFFDQPCNFARETRNTRSPEQNLYLDKHTVVNNVRRRHRKSSIHVSGDTAAGDHIYAANRTRIERVNNNTYRFKNGSRTRALGGRVLRCSQNNTGTGKQYGRTNTRAYKTINRRRGRDDEGHTIRGLSA